MSHRYGAESLFTVMTPPDVRAISRAVIVPVITPPNMAVIWLPVVSESHWKTEVKLSAVHHGHLKHRSNVEFSYIHPTALAGAGFSIQ